MNCQRAPVAPTVGKERDYSTIAVSVIHDAAVIGSTIYLYDFLMGWLVPSKSARLR
jgi:hypothetical protein